MSHVEYLAWRAFAQREPLGSARGDLHTAMLMLLLATINKGKRGRKPKLEDYLVDYWDDKRRPEMMARKFRAIAASAKAEVATPEAESTMRGRRRHIHG